MVLRWVVLWLCLASAGCYYDPREGMLEPRFERTRPAEVSRPEAAICRFEFEGKIYVFGGKDTEAAWSHLRMNAKLEAGMADIRRLKRKIASYDLSLRKILEREGVGHPDALRVERNQVDYDRDHDMREFYVDEHNAIAAECRSLRLEIVRNLEQHHDPRLLLVSAGQAVRSEP